MKRAINVSDIVEDNGRTVRQNNMAIKHRIPIGTLVEVNAEECEAYGIRAFVVKHERDCDGTPLYSLTINPHDIQYIGTDMEKYIRFGFSGGWSDNSLRIIRNDT